MPWPEAMQPVRMQRVALLSPRAAVRSLLVETAAAGTVAFDDLEPGAVRTPGTGPAAELLHRLGRGREQATALCGEEPDLAGWERAGRVDLIAGEAELERRAGQAVTRGRVAGFVGWMPAMAVAGLSDRVRGFGGAVVPMPTATLTDAPTLMPASGVSEEFAPLVDTYGTVPYADINPAVLAGLSYVAMFGMMFADVGHGALLLLAAAAIRWQWSPRLARLRRAWVFLAGAGFASMVFGALYGEFFGPTHVVPVIWMTPMSHPVPLLGAAVGVGAVLLAGAYAVGTVNRFREGGWLRALYAPSGLAGSAIFLGLGAVAGGSYFHMGLLAVLGGVFAASGVVAAFVGLVAAGGGGGAGLVRGCVELFDLVIRLATNLVSFARLAAFGLTHAALGAVVWSATVALADNGALGLTGAVAIFVLGNAVTFGLEGLVAAVQALRLEYYELFSRIFEDEGRPFRPWHIPIERTETAC